MLPRLEYIKQVRLRLGITQRKLATLTGISTSMINQIESGRCKPSYETARKIFEVLSSLEGRSSMKAGDICSRSPISVQKDEKLHKAIDVMRVNSISQIPVFDSSRVVGILTEDGLAKVMLLALSRLPTHSKWLNRVLFLQLFKAYTAVCRFDALIANVNFTLHG